MEDPGREIGLCLDTTKLLAISLYASGKIPMFDSKDCPSLIVGRHEVAEGGRGILSI